MHIDHVYTWVNPRDPELNKLRDIHARREVKSDQEYRAGSARIADHGELRFSLETARKHLPFVRRTFVFGSGAAPDWLSEFGDAITYVPQSAVVPAALWPAFQSNVVESFIHKIPDLSEHYIYSNDDFFFAKRHTPQDFFPREGHTRVGLIPGAAATGPNPTFRSVEENGIRALQAHVRLPRFNPNYPPLLKNPRPLKRLRTLRLYLDFKRRGLRLVNGIPHSSQPYLKSAWPGYLEVFGRELDQLYSRRFRSEFGMGVNFTYLHYLHGLGKTDFYVASNDRHLRRSASLEERERLRRDLLAPNSPVGKFCLNDTPTQVEDGWGEYISSLADALRR